MLTKQQSPEQAMKNVERRWNQITKRLGTEKQVKAIKAELRGVPDRRAGTDRTHRSSSS